VELVVPTVPDAKDLVDQKNNGGKSSTPTSAQPVAVTTVDTTPSAEPVDSLGSDRVATTWNWPLILIIGLTLGTLWGWYNQKREHLIVAAATEDDEEEATA
jgi:hypothetical protein